VGDARDELAQIRRVGYNETVFLRHYFGKVVANQDPNKKGRVKATILDLGWDTADKVNWAWPRAGHRLDVPKVGEWVEVYFMMGDRNRPAYLSGAAELEGNVPGSYSDPLGRVLFEDPTTGAQLFADGKTGIFSAKNSQADLFTVLDSVDGHLEDLVNHLISLTTFGPPPSHTLNPATITQLSGDLANIVADKSQLALILEKRK
jgi:hypothetical protein